MQWLVDLVIEAIGVPPCFIDRGDPAIQDYDKNDLTTDLAWHELDLSHIIPAGATAVTLIVTLMGPAVHNFMLFRTLGNTNEFNTSETWTQGAFILHKDDLVIPLDANRKIEYRASDVAWATILITIKGWWL